MDVTYTVCYLPDSCKCEKTSLIFPFHTVCEHIYKCNCAESAKICKHIFKVHSYVTSFKLKTVLLNAEELFEPAKSIVNRNNQIDDKNELKRFLGNV